MNGGKARMSDVQREEMTGREIKQRREAIGLLQFDLSKKLGFKYQGQLSHFEKRGDNTLASVYANPIDKALLYFERIHKGLPPVEKLEPDACIEIVRIFARSKTRKRNNGAYEVFIDNFSFGFITQTGNNRKDRMWHIDGIKTDGNLGYPTRETAVLAICVRQVGVI